MYIADAWPNEDHSICVGFIHPQRCGCQEFLEMSTLEDKIFHHREHRVHGENKGESL